MTTIDPVFAPVMQSYWWFQESDNVEWEAEPSVFKLPSGRNFFHAWPDGEDILSN